MASPTTRLRVTHPHLSLSNDPEDADEGKEKENPVIVDEQKDKNGDQHVVEEAADPVPCFVTVYKDETVVDRVELPGNSKLVMQNGTFVLPAHVMLLNNHRF